MDFTRWFKINDMHAAPVKPDKQKRVFPMPEIAPVRTDVGCGQIVMLSGNYFDHTEWFTSVGSNMSSVTAPNTRQPSDSRGYEFSWQAPRRPIPAPKKPPKFAPLLPTEPPPRAITFDD